MADLVLVADGAADIGERAAAIDLSPTNARRLGEALSVLRGYAWELDFRTGALWTSTPDGLPGQPATALGRNYADFENTVYPDDRARVRSVFVAHLKGETDRIECEYRVIANNDHVMWVLDRARVTERGPNGRALRIVGMRADITERKLEQERERLAQEAGRIGTYMIDMTDGSSAGNAVFYGFYGLPADQDRMTFAQWFERVHPDDREFVQSHVRDVLRGGAFPEIEYRIVRPDGSVIWTASRTQHEVDAHGRYVRAWGVQRDITEQKRAQIAVAEREAELSTIFNQALVGIAYRGMDGRLYSANARYCEIVGRSLDELRALGWRQVAHPDDVAEVDRLFAARERDDEPVVIELRCIRPDGEIVWCRAQLASVPATDTREASVVIVLDDITEQKRAVASELRLQAKLDQAARLVTANALGATLAHELQQPHAAITNFLHAAMIRLSSTSTPADIAPIVEAAAKETLRAGAIVRKMRHFVAMGRPATKPDDVAAIVTELLSVAPFNVMDERIETKIEHGLPAVDVDRVQVQQVLTNLLKNAIEASPDKGKIVIAARKAQGGEIEVSVIDAGPGIPQASEENLFQLFSSTKPQGLGLGLAIARTIIEAHGGRIWADSRPRRTAVHFTLRPAGTGVPL